MTPPSGVSSSLVRVWGTGPNDVFAVGESGTIIHFNGQLWQSSASPVSGSSETMSGVWGATANDVFVVGRQCTIIHFDGTTWASSPIESQPKNCSLAAVWGTRSDDVFAIGLGQVNAQVGAGGLRLHYDGKVWTGNPTDLPLFYNDAWGSGSVIYEFGTVHNASSLEHYDGVSWISDANATWDFDNSHAIYLGALWGSSPSDVYALGTSVGGVLVHYDGKSWSKAPPPPFAGSRGWASSSSDSFLVGAGGRIVHFDGRSWSETPSGTTQDLSGVWGSSASNVFAVGVGATILHYSCLP
jgi:hypothetical protein